jgi:2-dehydropantoate 2-reductase
LLFSVVARQAQRGNSPHRFHQTRFNNMKVTIFGAGAIGSHLAAKLAHGGVDVSIVARGAQLEAVKSRGVRFIHPDGTFTVPVRASASGKDLGPQDLVISTVKAHQLTAAIDEIKPLLHEETPIAYAINGIPWWYFHKAKGPQAEQRLTRLDPTGRLWDELGVDRALGCVITSSNELIEPGVVQNHTRDNSFTFGEPDGTLSPRLKKIVEALKPGISYAVATTDIRLEVWKKLLANMASSCLSSLTNARACDIAADADLLALYSKVVAEGQAVAASLGLKVEFETERRFTRMATSAHRPSMTQDLNAGRPMEIDAQLAIVRELARQGNVSTPNFDVCLTLLIARASQAGLYAR